MCTNVEILPESCREDIQRIQERVEELKSGEVTAAVERSCINHVLLTGATSFVGQFLLLALLQKRPGLTVTCTLPEDEGSTSMQESILWPEIECFVENGSVRLVSFDPTKSQDIDSDSWNELSNSVDAVLLFPDDDDKILGNYENIREGHTQTLLSVLEFCMTKRLKHLGYASSMNVFPAYTARFGGKYGNTPLPESPSVKDMLELFPLDVMGHPWSKLVGERGISTAARHGVPTHIYRLPSTGASSISGICNENDIFIRLRSAIQQVNMYPMEFPKEHAGFEQPADIVAAIVVNSLLERSTLQQSACTEGVSSLLPVVLNCVRPDDVAALHAIIERPMLPRADSYTTTLLGGFNPTVCSWKEFKAECLNLGQKSPLHGYWTLIDHMESFWFANGGKANGARPHINTASCGEVSWPDPQQVALDATLWQQVLSTSSWSLPVFTPKLDVEDMLSTAAIICGVPKEDLLDKDAEVAFHKVVDELVNAENSGKLKRGKYVAWLELQLNIGNFHHVMSSTTTKNNVKPRQDPIIICGLNRSGTSFIQGLMAVDPQFRTLQWQEMASLTSSNGYPLFILKGWLHTAPRLQTLHGLVPHKPEEDFFLFNPPFRSFWGLHFSELKAYNDWIMEEGNMVPGYEFHAKALALKEVENKSNKRWLLKCPYHTIFLPEVLSQYPKASFIWSHRDPLKLIPSNCDLYDALQTLWGEGWETEQGKKDGAQNTVLPLCREIVERGMKFRAENEDVKFIDVSYNELIADSLTVVKDIYKQLNLNLLPEIEERMAKTIIELYESWKGKGSKAQVSDFGITNDEIQSIFHDYIQFCSKLGIKC